MGSSNFNNLNEDVIEAAHTLYIIWMNHVNNKEQDNNEQRPLLPLAAVGDAPEVSPWMREFADIIGVHSPSFVKKLTITDMSVNHGRVTVSKEFVELNLVPLFNADENLNEGIDVMVFDAQKREFNMTFKRWSNKLYVLTKGWNRFVQTNNLEANESVTMGMFRHANTGRLCFAITQ